MPLNLTISINLNYQKLFDRIVKTKFEKLSLNENISIVKKKKKNLKHIYW